VCERENERETTNTFPATYNTLILLLKICEQKFSVHPKHLTDKKGRATFRF